MSALVSNASIALDSSSTYLAMATTAGCLVMDCCHRSMFVTDTTAATAIALESSRYGGSQQ
jgi:hypothetical protein